MCGIVGIINLDQEFIDKSLLLKMTSVLSHRGPDDEGYLLVNTDTGDYLTAGGKDTPQAVYSSNFMYSPNKLLQQTGNNSYNLALGHRRLSILDLSAAGHQPMCNEAGSIWTVHNGEVYNYVEIRDELRSKGYTFRSNTDTEVIIKAYEEWDTSCLNRFNGMWAFCIWDSTKRELFCARDRLGIKPFYYYFDGNIFAFASEIKALLQMGIRREPNDALIFDFLKFGILDHTDDSFFKNIKKLPYSHYLKIASDGRLTLYQYWDVEVSDELEGSKSDEKIAQDFLSLFTDAVRIRLRSDVPIGSCLSGGLDSSSVVTVANNLMYPEDNSAADERQKTFSACYEDKRFDERGYIDEVIRKTNAEKNYVFPTADGFLRELSSLVWHQEEPFAGSSVYAQWEVIKKAREGEVKVLLDGQGGDEQLAGYRKFYIFYFLELLKRRRVGKLLSESTAFFLSPEILRTLNLRSGLRYFDISSKMLGIDHLLRDSFRKKFQERQLDIGYQGNLGWRMRDDILRFSLPVLLRYEDRNSMAHAVEARLPFLDYRLVEMLASLPLNQKMRDGWTKYVLRNAMRGTLPEKVRLRKTKLGFDTPEDDWFRTVISKDVEDVFNRAVFITDYVDTEKLQSYFAKYVAGKSMHQSSLFFRFYILELWGRKFILDR
jgi:asparagine synthase (glutamine-hydrolysing)